ncbi:MAG: DNA-processing protein DprA [Pseudomonadota bacterium]
METLLPWLILKSVPGVGNVLFKRLIDHFQTPARVLGAPAEHLIRVEGISDRVARLILGHRLTDPVKQELDSIQKTECRIVTLTDVDYPPLLKEIPDPPPYLYFHGDHGYTAHCIAVVGSRNATAYGIGVTRQLCRELSKAGFVLVSGLARGIDTAAHEGALMEGGRTLAVLGSGLQCIYPKENRPLARSISKSGAVISELPLHAAPEAHHFPARNRIISGLCLGTVVVEAAMKSGALITARLALEQNREVFAVPGSIGSSKSGGTHGLIKQGAKLVENAEDVIEELVPIMKRSAVVLRNPPSSETSYDGFSTEEARILKALSPYPVHIDEIARSLRLPVGILSGTLLRLELKGVVRQTSGNFCLSMGSPGKKS